jgi:hypothetical protein
MEKDKNMKNKKVLLNKLEVLIDNAINFELETYDRDVLESIYKLFVNSDVKEQIKEKVCYKKICLMNTGNRCDRKVAFYDNCTQKQRRKLI